MEFFIVCAQIGTAVITHFCAYKATCGALTTLIPSKFYLGCKPFAASSFERLCLTFAQGEIILPVHWACNEDIHVMPLCLSIAAFTLANGTVE